MLKNRFLPILYCLSFKTPTLPFGLGFFRKVKRMSVLTFSVGMEKPSNILFSKNVYTKSPFVGQSDVSGLLLLTTSRFWQSRPLPPPSSHLCTCAFASLLPQDTSGPQNIPGQGRRIQPRADGAWAGPPPAAVFYRHSGRPEVSITLKNHPSKHWQRVQFYYIGIAYK